MTQATLIKADGNVQKIEPKNGKTFTLEELQTYVGGYIEIVYTYDRNYMVVDEEGKLKNKRPNIVATGLYEFGRFEMIVGDAVVCPTTMID